MTARLRPTLTVLTLGGLLALTGCGGSSTLPVEGTIVFADTQQPARELAGYTVTFEQTEQKVSATGVVRPDGTFRLTTYKEEDGAVPGKHKVAITPPIPEVDTPAPPPLIPPRYSGLDSGLEVEVKAGQPEVTLTVERIKR